MQVNFVVEAMNSSRPIRLLVRLALAGLLPLAAARAETRTWIGPANGDWFTATNWSSEQAPTNAGDSALITNGTVLLASNTAALTDFTLTNATLVFSNWNTRLEASNVAIWNRGTVTVANAFATNQMSNRVWIVCSNCSVLTGGAINVDAKGFAGQNGPGRGSGTGGGGYGGRGGNGNVGSGGGSIYGSTNCPDQPGSGGGANGAGDGHGGGLIQILASGGSVQVEGALSANGRTSSGGYTPGGSGGGIYIECRTIAGGGAIRANGGNGTSDNKGGGGGGRIAVAYDSVAQALVEPKPGILFTVLPGSSATGVAADLGTLYFPGTLLLKPLLSLSACLYFEAACTNWGTDSLTVSNGYVFFPPDFALRVTNDLAVIAGGRLSATNAGGLGVGGNVTVTNGRLDYGFGDACSETFSIGGDVTVNNTGQFHYLFATANPTSLALTGNIFLTNSGALYLYAGRSNTAAAYGGLLSLTGRNLTIPTNCNLYPVSHPTNGGSIKMLVSNLTVQAGGAINADTLGYVGKTSGGGNGPGAGAQSCGGGYGGHGGGSGGGVAYGSTNYPAQPGSSAGNSHIGYAGPNGGGLIWIETTNGALQVDGTLSANGGTGVAGDYNGGGAGGGILLVCRTFSGGGSLRANGGSDSTDAKGAGGGGRISVAIGFTCAQLAELIGGADIPGLTPSVTWPSFSGTISATNGVSANPATPGTLQFIKVVSPTERTVIIAGDPANYDSPATNGYGDAWTFEEGTVLTNTVTSPVSETNGMRWTCYGWRVAKTAGGELLASGGSTQAVFTISTNVTLTWRWTNQYRLAVAAGPNGTVNEDVNGWYTNGIAVTGLQATAADPAHYYFSAWGGTVPDDQQEANPLTVIMDRARTNITASFATLAGEDKIWNGTGNWTTAANWSPEGAPGTNDTVLLQSGTAVLSSLKRVAALTVSNAATLLFTNWSACLNAAGEVTVLSNGVITHAVCNTNPMVSNTNRVHVLCSTLDVRAGGKINVDAKGYATAQGPGTTTGDGGGGYGGWGGNGNSGSGGPPYGSTNYPLQPGSAAAPYNAGGFGGGLIWVIAGTARVDGALSANGETPAGAYTPGGAGGAILLECRTIVGGGAIRANGGNGTTDNKGGGGGGRIAVWLDVPPNIRNRYLESVGGDGRAVVCSTNWTQFGGTFSANNGTNGNGVISATPGTMRFFQYVRGAQLGVR